MVGDFTGHQVELLQTSAFLGDDFHTPATREGIMHEPSYRRSPGGAVSSVKTAAGPSPFKLLHRARMRGRSCSHILPLTLLKNTLMIEHLI